MLNGRVPDLSRERKYLKLGKTRVAGIDEAGRGPLAGPVSAAAVILPPRFRCPERAIRQEFQEALICPSRIRR